MLKPCIICVAITGSLPTKANNPAVPISIAEQIESSQEAFEVGATIAHCHVRDQNGRPTSDPERFAQLLEGLRKHCPGMIVQFSTGGRSGAGKDRGGMLGLKPDMASLSVGSNNFPTRVYENSPDLVNWLASEMRTHGVKPEIEAFDLSHVVQATKMSTDGRLDSPLYVQFVMGVQNSMPADEPILISMWKPCRGSRPQPNGVPQELGRLKSKSMNGQSQKAATRVQVLRTTYELIDIR